MSATFYPAKQESEKVWGFVEVPYEVNLSNYNTRLVLGALGLDPHFEDSNTQVQTIEDFIERCHAFIDGSSLPSLPADGYILRRVAQLLVSATLGKQNGATHWYFN
ncbi:MAG: hypothetical protein CL985_00225 [Euryarchaeota archaeon]|jgi:hypothetical protein|nr:hypothetical protein [Euryarchaeota archaeon]|tara:strand:+ start:2815 stop:3132 length:318 start_codon:yes stop_codon:yes gene_type:complete